MRNRRTGRAHMTIGAGGPTGESDGSRHDPDMRAVFRPASRGYNRSQDHINAGLTIRARGSKPTQRIQPDAHHRRTST